MKAKLNEGDNRTMYERIINVLISGIVTTTNVKLGKESESLFYEIQFNSILPDDLKSTVETLASGVEAGIISKETAVGILDMTEDVEVEMELIKKGLVVKADKVSEIVE